MRISSNCAGEFALSGAEVTILAPGVIGIAFDSPDKTLAGRPVRVRVMMAATVAADLSAGMFKAAVTSMTAPGGSDAR